MPIKYIPYYPETIEGQAILNNFVRTRRVLEYKDNDKVYSRISRGLPLYEVETIEKVGDNSNNLLIRGECLSTCAYLKDQGIKVDLVYIDPPFASGADYSKKIYIRKNPKLRKKLIDVEVELDVDDLESFEEKMYGDIWNKEDYLNWIYENLMGIKSIMSDNASIYVHLDSHIGHYVKIILDEIFGDSSFINHISWMRSHAHGDTGQGAKHLGRVMDMIFYYRLGDNFVWNPIHLNYSEEAIKRDYKYTEDNGRRYRLVPVDGPGGIAKGNPYYEFRGITGAWRYSKAKMEKLYKQGLIVISKTGKSVSMKKYLDEAPGKSLTDLWNDVWRVSPTSSERVDYPTQKPEALLERIIKLSSNEGSIVADFFGGSGVTAKVSNKLNRNFISCDIGINSIYTSREGLLKNAEFNILEVKDGVSLYRNPSQTMQKLKSLIIGLKNEDSLDSFWEGAIQDTKSGLVPVYIPNLLDHSTKLLDIPVIHRVMNEAMPDLPEDVKKVIVYYIDIEDEKEINKYISDFNPTNIKIELRDLKTVLDDVVLEDIIDYKITKSKVDFEIEIKSIISDRLIQKIDEYNQKKKLNRKHKQGDILDDEESEEDDSKKKKKKFTPIVISEEGLELIELISLDCTNKDGVWKSDTEIKIDKFGYVIKDGEKTKEFWDGKILSKKKPLRIKVRNIAGDETIIVF